MKLSRKREKRERKRKEERKKSRTELSVTQLFEDQKKGPTEETGRMAGER